MFSLGLAVLAGGLLLSLVWERTGLLLALVGLGIWALAVLAFLWSRLRGVPLSHPARKVGASHAGRLDISLEDDRAVGLDDPELPAAVREAVQRDAKPGDVLWRCVRQGAPTGPLAVLGWGHRPLVVEWWLMSAEGDLIEAYWLER